tara:strand:+ start:25878 stop:26759 length:882 start_codon:yes stop_codon:yes gene_type:complete
VYSEKNVMSQDEFNQVAREATAAIVMTSIRVTKELIDSAPKLRVISNFGVGYDNIDVAYARKKGIIATNTPDVLTTSCAELGVALVMATSRRLVEGYRLMERNEFKGWKVDLLLGSELRNKTLGILGCGRIGQSMAGIMSGFGLNLLYHNRSKLNEDIEKELGIRYVDFLSLTAQSDILVVAAPLNDDNRHMFMLDTFREMKKNSILINIGRGGIINEQDLLVALKEGFIGGAGLDVFENPHDIPPELRYHPKVTLTPHIGSGTQEARDSMSELAVQAVVDVLNGKRPQYEIR